MCKSAFFGADHVADVKKQKRIEKELIRFFMWLVFLDLCIAKLSLLF